ncbi:hypothetical protein PF010_g33019 [Phytophthora fragariae]|uniref:Uncharacterized protein n=1 Tax=Phytophthora fragariae TaxID=53985 RepID=A0A6A3DBP4_9STRA|nr:hypothetical protein PF009_g32017 [Phytophthora fragariae]KAE9053178.1 hypothetical protein PF010_g33019 [Phytophthora fragariae]KAE9056717.1 hypothetical protein PF006_g32604 [Phytophthora fragariae]KAE9260184.1 hypothetical protein PF001_g32792 [Phytophthora fragariae]KAE9266013.1 hypothetical protein PF008_g31713 [Phytophthora fragariae]
MATCPKRWCSNSICFLLSMSSFNAAITITPGTRSAWSRQMFSCISNFNTVSGLDNQAVFWSGEHDNR